MLTEDVREAIRTDMHCAGAQAIGMLTALLRLDLLPEDHRPHARAIVSRYDAGECKIAAHNEEVLGELAKRK